MKRSVDPLILEIAKDLASDQRRRRLAPVRGGTAIVGGDIATLLGERPVHVLDDGASQQIADYGPVDAEEMPAGYEGQIEIERPRDAPDEVMGLAEGAHEQIRGRTQEVFRDDLTEHLRQMAIATIGPRGERLDDFDSAYNMAGREVQALREIAPWTRHTPPSVMSALLGKQVAVKNDGVRVPCARWEGENAESQAVTVTVGPIEALVGDLGPTLIPTAHLRWGTRDFSVSADVDIGQGFQLTLNCSSIYLDLSSPLVAGDPAATLQMTGMLSFQPCVRTSPMTKTEIFTLSNGTTSSRLNIPKFAKRIIGFVREDATQVHSIYLHRYSSGVVWTYVQAAAATGSETKTTLPDPIVIPGDIGKYSVRNDGGAGTTCKIVFELAL